MAEQEGVTKTENPTLTLGRGALSVASFVLWTRGCGWATEEGPALGSFLVWEVAINVQCLEGSRMIPRILVWALRWRWRSRLGWGIPSVISWACVCVLPCGYWGTGRGVLLPPDGQMWLGTWRTKHVHGERQEKVQGRERKAQC